MRPAARLFVAPMLAVLIVGCSQKHDSSVSGKVTFNGAPLTSGTVAFTREGGGPMAYASIQADGSYRVQTGQDKGLQPGEYLVAVSSTKPLPPPKAGVPEPTPEPTIPTRYFSNKTSQLKFTVKPGSNTYDISLAN